MLGATRLSMMENIQFKAILVTLPPGEVVVEEETKAEYLHFVIDGALEVGAMLDDDYDNYDKKGMGSGIHGHGHGSISVNNRNVYKRNRSRNKVVNNGEQQDDDDESSNFQRLYQVLPGDTIGQMSCFTDEVSFVTVRTSKPTITMLPITMTMNMEEARASNTKRWC